MSKLLTTAIWLIRKALSISAADWQLIFDLVKVADENLNTITGAEKKAWVWEKLKGAISSQALFNLLVELAVVLIRK